MRSTYPRPQGPCGTFQRTASTLRLNPRPSSSQRLPIGIPTYLHLQFTHQPDHIINLCRLKSLTLLAPRDTYHQTSPGNRPFRTQRRRGREGKPRGKLPVQPWCQPRREIQNLTIPSEISNVFWELLLETAVCRCDLHCGSEKRGLLLSNLPHC